MAISSNPVGAWPVGMRDCVCVGVRVKLIPVFMFRSPHTTTHFHAQVISIVKAGRHHRAIGLLCGHTSITPLLMIGCQATMRQTVHMIGFGRQLCQQTAHRAPECRQTPLGRASATVPITPGMAPGPQAVVRPLRFCTEYLPVPQAPDCARAEPASAPPSHTGMPYIPAPGGLPAAIVPDCHDQATTQALPLLYSLAPCAGTIAMPGKPHNCMSVAKRMLD